jgi:hypothetical protein
VRLYQSLSAVRAVGLSVFFLRNSFYQVTKVYENQAEGFHTNDSLVGVFFQDCVFME